MSSKSTDKVTLFSINGSFTFSGVSAEHLQTIQDDFQEFLRVTSKSVDGVLSSSNLATHSTTTVRTNEK